MKAIALLVTLSFTCLLGSVAHAQEPSVAELKLKIANLENENARLKAQIESLLKNSATEAAAVDPAERRHIAPTMVSAAPQTAPATPADAKAAAAVELARLNVALDTERRNQIEWKNKLIAKEAEWKQKERGLQVSTAEKEALRQKVAAALAASEQRESELKIEIAVAKAAVR